MSVIQFINHACVLIEAKDHVLLVDPWLEGTAFYDGWALLDRSTSNAALVASLKHKGKPISIWYSHEHSDHFSIGCLKCRSSTSERSTGVYSGIFKCSGGKWLSCRPAQL